MKLFNSAKRFGVNIVRRVLGAANIDPALVKALVRKSEPVHGGPRARKMPWPRRRHIDTRAKQAVLRVFDREIRQGGAIVDGGKEEKAYC